MGVQQLQHLLLVDIERSKGTDEKNGLFFCVRKTQQDIIAEKGICKLNWNPRFQFASLSSDLANRLQK